MAAIDIVSPSNLKKVNRLLSLRVIIVKIISSLVMVLGGGAIGREGPTIQIAASIFRKVNKILPAWWPKISKRNMIMTGSAAGLAAAFNTPLGGIVFAVEELTKTHISYFKTALFSAVIIAGLTAQGLLGPYLYLGYPNVGNLSGYIFLLVIIVAGVAGVGGSFMSKIMLWLFKWKSTFKLKYQTYLYVGACAIIMAFVAYFVYDGGGIFGSGKELMTDALFKGERTEWYMPVLRFCGPILSFTTGAAGGVFAPSLSAGASIGSVMSDWLELDPGNTNLLILAGMVGFLTGVTRSPFTSAILVLEMTDRHSVIFHLMLAGMIATIVSLVIDKHSFYDHLKEKYIDELNKEEDVVQNNTESGGNDKQDPEPKGGT
jgi:H+/Cl- antiporter ClcA